MQFLLQKLSYFTFISICSLENITLSNCYFSEFYNSIPDFEHVSKMTDQEDQFSVSERFIRIRVEIPIWTASL